MGIDADEFVSGDLISSQLICPICTSVLEHPVQTEYEHLFCEEELLEWMAQSENRCPVTHKKLDPDKIRKPSRIIVNMLAELQRYCSNKKNGCSWIGENEHHDTHKAVCLFKPREELNAIIEAQAAKIKSLRTKLAHAEEDNSMLKEKNRIISTELKIYDSFLKSKGAFDDDNELEAAEGSEHYVGRLLNDDGEFEDEGEGGASRERERERGGGEQDGVVEYNEEKEGRGQRKQSTLEKIARLRAIVTATTSSSTSRK